MFYYPPSTLPKATPYHCINHHLGARDGFVVNSVGVGRRLDANARFGRRAPFISGSTRLGGRR